MTTSIPPETEPLLLDTQGEENQPLFPRQEPERRWKANPYWVIPIVLVVNIARGMTLSPRINVFTDIACRAVEAANLVAQDCEAPAVAARASKVQASVLTIMNVLSSASTGLWSQYGDVKGRKIVFCVSICGFVAMEFIFLLVSKTSFTAREDVFILIGPVLEGFAGGLSVFNGVVHAYVSDCSPDGSRSRIFSLLQGGVFCGLAIGPWIAGVLLSYTSLGVYSMFSISIILQLVLLAYIILVLPESLRKKESLELRSPHDTTLVQVPSPNKGIRSYLRRFMVALISPITIFRPRKVEVGTTSKFDYNVTLMGLAMFLYITSTAVYPLKYLYGRRTFTWDPKQLGYYMSLLWICRATNLFFVLPVIVRYFKPKTPITGASTPDEIASELNFDKRLAQGSLVVDALADMFVAVSSSELAFVAFSCLSAFTSGGNPALHSLGAVCLHALGYSEETGRLFGAIGVLNAISHSISPGLFAFTYSSTVETHPKTIFVLASGMLCTSVFLLSFIRARGW
ncbi:hypothetical protein MIND_00250500 [Mycena indigotica]|uniref:MFS general substrate transporter n=1 Tax=Mycena indigotica TaxID=2126181 RepID=A0A8H6T9F4_9AGAR|nr:uncharacterized protein MIND_00250500 [Mycena indigotica]KAF7312372.1 hypothetical protein MIND_00250500 [Mycena indigotica]